MPRPIDFKPRFVSVYLVLMLRFSVAIRSFQRSAPCGRNGTLCHATLSRVVKNKSGQGKTMKKKKKANEVGYTKKVEELYCSGPSSYSKPRNKWMSGLSPGDVPDYCEHKAQMAKNEAEHQSLRSMFRLRFWLQSPSSSCLTRTRSHGPWYGYPYHIQSRADLGGCPGRYSAQLPRRTCIYMQWYSLRESRSRWSWSYIWWCPFRWSYPLELLVTILSLLS